MSRFIATRTVATLFALALGGCATWETLTFSPDEAHSDKTAHQTPQLHYLNQNWRNDSAFATDLMELMPDNEQDNIRKTFDTCAGVPPKPEVEREVAAPFLLLVPVAAQYIFDLAANALAGYAAQLQDRGERGYTASLIVSGEDLQPPTPKESAQYTLGCLVLLRTETDPTSEAKPGMVTIIRLVGYDNIIRFEPMYARFDNAMALTEQGEGGAGGRIDAIYAISVTVARPANQGSYPKQVMLGVGEFRLAGVQLGTGKSAFTCGSPGQEPCLVQTKSIDRPDDDTTSIEFSVAVREIGTLVNEAKRAEAQIKTIKDAVGPQIRSTVEGLISARQ